jgi:ribonucleoside-diphosphate reductase alpha chain
MARTSKFKIIGQHVTVKGYITIGFDEENKPRELFLKMHGSQFNGWTNTIGILISIMLQHDIPMETIVSKLEFQSFDPCGMTTHPKIRMARSIVDYVGRYLGYEFIPNYRKSKDVEPE